MTNLQAALRDIEASEGTRRLMGKLASRWVHALGMLRQAVDAVIEEREVTYTAQSYKNRDKGNAWCVRLIVRVGEPGEETFHRLKSEIFSQLDEQESKGHDLEKITQGQITLIILPLIHKTEVHL